MIDVLEGVKAVIFDLDGLLLDSEPVWMEVSRRFFKKYKLVDHKDLNVKGHGTGMREFIELVKQYTGLKGDTETFLREYRDMFYTLFRSSERFRLMEGAEELIEVLQEQQIPLAIATGGHKREKVIEMLKKFRLESVFSVIVSSDDVKKGKPAPDVYLLTAKKLKTDPKYCVVLEDSANGVKSAKAAGMKAIGINSDYALQKRLEEADADIVTPSLEAILPLFEEECCQGNRECACA